MGKKGWNLVVNVPPVCAFSATRIGSNVKVLDKKGLVLCSSFCWISCNPWWKSKMRNPFRKGLQTTLPQLEKHGPLIMPPENWSLSSGIRNSSRLGKIFKKSPVVPLSNSSWFRCSKDLKGMERSKIQHSSIFSTCNGREFFLVNK